MTSEFAIAVKDSIKINILKEVLEKRISLYFKLNDEKEDNYAFNIHNGRSRVNVYGKFNISEDPNGEILTIRPTGLDCVLKIIIEFSKALEGKKISIIRSATKTVEKELELTPKVSSIQFVPQGQTGYRLLVFYREENENGTAAATKNKDLAGETAGFGVIYREDNRFNNNGGSGFDRRNSEGEKEGSKELPDDEQYRFINNSYPGFESRSRDRLSQKFRSVKDRTAEQGENRRGGSLYENEAAGTGQGYYDDTELEKIEEKITRVERSREQLAVRKQLAVEHLKKIEEEYKKDYSLMERELEEIKSRLEADAAILEYYKDRDIVPIEKIFKEAGSKLEEAEKQIRAFIEAKQKKTMKIEQEIKSNKKQ